MINICSNEEERAWGGSSAFFPAQAVEKAARAARKAIRQEREEMYLVLQRGVDGRRGLTLRQRFIRTFFVGRRTREALARKWYRGYRKQEECAVTALLEMAIVSEKYLPGLNLSISAADFDLLMPYITEVEIADPR